MQHLLFYQAPNTVQADCGSMEWKVKLALLHITGSMFEPQTLGLESLTLTTWLCTKKNPSQFYGPETVILSLCWTYVLVITQRSGFSHVGVVPKIFNLVCSIISGCTVFCSRSVTGNIHTLTLKVLVATIDAQWEGMGDVGSARHELALLPPCPTIRVLSYSN